MTFIGNHSSARLLVTLWCWAVMTCLTQSLTVSPSAINTYSPVKTCDLPHPTREDDILEHWYLRRGILGTHRVKVRTTPTSVAGRGIFLSGMHAAEKGDILALIPSSCILTHSIVRHRWPDLGRKLERISKGGQSESNIHYDCNNDNNSNNNNNDDDNNNGKDDWPAMLTAYAQEALKGDDDIMSEWISTWKGPAAPRHSLSPEELESLAVQTQSTPMEVKKAATIRYQAMQQHKEMLVSCGVVLDSSSSSSMDEDLYGIVLSRSANLGPEWEFQSGIIPLHDMLNHPPSDVESSIELFSIGEISRLTSPEHVQCLISKAFNNQHLHNLHCEKDLVLVARRAISPGEELFLSYNGSKRNLSEQARIWRTLQYGFSFT